MVSVSGVGKVRRAEQPIEFFRIAGGDEENHVLFVNDVSRSWLNGPEVAELIMDTIRAVANYIKADQIVLIGNSMGGTMALHLAALMKVDVVVAHGAAILGRPEGDAG